MRTRKPIECIALHHYIGQFGKGRFELRIDSRKPNVSDSRITNADIDGMVLLTAGDDARERKVVRQKLESLGIKSAPVRTAMIEEALATGKSAFTHALVKGTFKERDGVFFVFPVALLNDPGAYYGLPGMNTDTFMRNYVVLGTGAFRTSRAFVSNGVAYKVYEDGSARPVAS